MSFMKEFAEEFYNRENKRRAKELKALISENLTKTDKQLYDLFVDKGFWKLYKFWFKDKIKFEYDARTKDQYVLIYDKKFSVDWGYEIASGLTPSGSLSIAGDYDVLSIAYNRED